MDSVGIAIAMRWGMLRYLLCSLALVAFAPGCSSASDDETTSDGNGAAITMGFDGRAAAEQMMTAKPAQSMTVHAQNMPGVDAWTLGLLDDGIVIDAVVIDKQTAKYTTSYRYAFAMQWIAGEHGNADHFVMSGIAVNDEAHANKDAAVRTLNAVLGDMNAAAEAVPDLEVPAGLRSSFEGRCGLGPKLILEGATVFLAGADAVLFLVSVGMASIISVGAAYVIYGNVEEMQKCWRADAIDSPSRTALR